MPPTHQGVTVTEEGVARAHAARAAVDVAWPAERYQAIRDRVRQATADDPAGRVSAA